MIEQETILGIIPAYDAEIGFIARDLYPLLDKPLLQYTIEEAQKSQYFNRLIVSSEEAQVIEFADTFGVETDNDCLDRSLTDQDRLVEVVLHALDRLEECDQLPDVVVVLSPTTPLRTIEEIEAAILQFLENDSDSLVSVHPVSESLHKYLSVQDGGWEYSCQSQLPVEEAALTDGHYLINDAICIVTPQFLREHRQWVVKGASSLFMMDAASGMHVNDLANVYQVEALLKMRQVHMK